MFFSSEHTTPSSESRQSSPAAAKLASAGPAGSEPVNSAPPRRISPVKCLCIDTRVLGTLHHWAICPSGLGTCFQAWLGASTQSKETRSRRGVGLGGRELRGRGRRGRRHAGELTDTQKNFDVLDGPGRRRRGGGRRWRAPEDGHETAHKGLAPAARQQPRRPRAQGLGNPPIRPRGEARLRERRGRCAHCREGGAPLPLRRRAVVRAIVPGIPPLATRAESNHRRRGACWLRPPSRGGLRISKATRRHHPRTASASHTAASMAMQARVFQFATPRRKARGDSTTTAEGRTRMSASSHHCVPSGRSPGAKTSSSQPGRMPS